MTPENEIKEDLKNLVDVSDKQLQLLIDYVIQKEKQATQLEKHIWKLLKTKYEL